MQTPPGWYWQEQHNDEIQARNQHFTNISQQRMTRWKEHFIFLSFTVSFPSFALTVLFLTNFMFLTCQLTYFHSRRVCYHNDVYVTTKIQTSYLKQINKAWRTSQTDMNDNKNSWLPPWHYFASVALHHSTGCKSTCVLTALIPDVWAKWPRRKEIIIIIIIIIKRPMVILELGSP